MKSRPKLELGSRMAKYQFKHLTKEEMNEMERAPKWRIYQAIDKMMSFYEGNEEDDTDTNNLIALS